MSILFLLLVTGHLLHSCCARSAVSKLSATARRILHFGRLVKAHSQQCNNIPGLLHIHVVSDPFPFMESCTNSPMHFCDLIIKEKPKNQIKNALPTRRYAAEIKPADATAKQGGLLTFFLRCGSFAVLEKPLPSLPPSLPPYEAVTRIFEA